MLAAIALLVLVNLTITFADDSAGKPYFLHLDENSGKTYYVSTNIKLPYVQAMRFCNNLNMTLVTVNSAEENQALWKLLKSKNDYFWSSGSKLIDGRTWLWLSTGKPVSFTNWDNGEPSSTNEYCISLKADSRDNIFWNDEKCQTERSFVCESKEKNTKDKITDSVWSNIFNSKRVSDELIFENKQFYFARQYKGSFWQSLQFCEMIGMMSASILSDSETQRIYKHLRDTSAESVWWSSGTRSTDGIHWFWLSNGIILKDAPWGSGEPNNEKDEQCISVKVVDQGVILNDLPCSLTAPVICERPVKDKITRQSRSIDLQAEQPKENECEQPVINIYINNNVAGSESQDFSPINIVDKSSKSEHFILVDNKWNSCKK